MPHPPDSAGKGRRPTRRIQARPLGALLLGAVLWLPGSAEAQVLLGRVADLDNGEEVRHATVRLEDAGGETRVTTSTDGGGRFYLRPGRLAEDDRLVVEALGYRAQRIRLGDLDAFSAAGIEVTVDLPPSPLAVDGLVAEIGSEALVPHLVSGGFYERRRSHHGHFEIIDEARRAGANLASDYFRNILGVRLDRRNNLQGAEPRLRGGQGHYAFIGGTCYPTVILNGALVRRGGPPSDRVTASAFDQIVGANHVLAIEVYRSAAEVPARWSGSLGACGVIALWTR